MVSTPEHSQPVFIPYRGIEDAEAIYRVMRGCLAEDGIDPLSGLEQLPSLEVFCEEISRTDPQNTLLVEADGQIVAYNRIVWWTETDGLVLYLHLGRVLPAYRNRGIGTALLEWSEQRIRTLAVAQGGPGMFGANASSTETDATRLLTDHGYAVHFSLDEMAMSLAPDYPPVPAPAYLDVRPPQPDDAEALWRAQMAAYADIPPVGDAAPEDTDIADVRHSIETQGHLWQIAWDGDTIAGQVWCHVHEHDGAKVGSIDEVHTSRGYRRQGVAQALISMVLARFSAMGISEVRLFTVSDNRRGAKTLYERIGFRTIKTFPRYRKAL